MNLGIETETLEFKKSTSEAKEACISIAAMLNKHGVGTVYFGVKPDGTVGGQDVTEETLRKVSRAISQTIKPQIYPTVTKLELDKRTVIEVEANGTDTPYSAGDKYYLRTADEDRPVTPSALRNFFNKQAVKDSWEETDSGTPVTNINAESFHRFLNEARETGRLPETPESDSELLTHLGLTTGANLNNAGNLLFGTGEPVTLQMAIFATPEKITFLDIQRSEANIYTLLDVAEQYVLKNIHWRARIDRGTREEIPEIPAAAIREIIANSFAHADYRMHKPSHEICVYPDRVTVLNPGSFASNHTPQQYVDESLPAMPRNPLIAKTLYLGHRIEQFGSGLKRVAALCNDADVTYSFDDYETSFMVTLERRSDKKVTTDVTTDVTLSSTETAVLALLTQNPRQTRQEMADKISKTTRTVQRALNTLTAKGYIRREGSRATPTWKVLE